MWDILYLCPVLSGVSRTAFTGSQHDIYQSSIEFRSHPIKDKIFHLLKSPPMFLFFLHAKLEVLRSFFPPFGEAMPSTKPDKNRVSLLKAHATTNDTSQKFPTKIFCIRPSTLQAFYEEKLEDDYRMKRFKEIGKKEGFTQGKIEKQLQEGKVLGEVDSKKETV